MKKYLFPNILFIFVIGGVFFALLPAAESVAEGTVQEAAAMADELIAARTAAQGASWSSSLSEIQQTAAGLVEANSKLSLEYRDLSDQVQALKDAVAVQKGKNSEHLAALQQRKDDIAAPQKALTARSGLTELERSVAQKREALSVMQAKNRSLDNKIALRKLQLQELELDEKAVLVDFKTSGPADLRDELAALKDQVESQAEQERIIREQLAVLQKDGNPALSEARMVSQEVADLKRQLAQVVAEARGPAGQAAAGDPAKEEIAARYRSLLQEKEALASRAGDFEQQRRGAERRSFGGSESIKDLKQKIALVEKENEALVTGIDDLRENIAVLEYKMSSLERYQDRNRKRGR